MNSTFMGVEIAKRALQAQSQSLTVTQNNVSNAENPDYSRQVANISTYEPLYLPGLNMALGAGQIGQGVYVESINRVRDQFLDVKINNETSYKNYFDTIVNYSQQIDSIYNEPNGVSLQQSITDFFNAFNDLSKEPESTVNRVTVKEKATAMVNQFHTMFNGLYGLQKNVNEEIKNNVNNINSLLKKLALLNNKIMKIKATGQNPNDLEDTRDKLVNELSKYIDISVKKESTFNIYSKGKIIVQGNIANTFTLEQNPDNNGFYNLVLDNENFIPQSGKIKALFDMRDKVIGNQLEKLNQLALSLVEGVNDLHYNGMTLKGEKNIAFFKELPLTLYTNGTYDKNNDGLNDSVVIYKLIGTNKINGEDKLMIDGALTINGQTIAYHANDTVNDLLKRINLANTGINFSLSNGYLEIKGNSSSNGIFSIKNLSDSGQFLSDFAGVLKRGAVFSENNLNAVASLFQTNQIYLLSPLKNVAGWIDLNDAIKNDVSNIAAASIDKELKEGNGEIAYKISKLIDDKFFIRNSDSIVNYYSSMVNDYSTIGYEAKQEMDTHTLVLSNFQKLRMSYSGVNMDEELANMMKFQKVYQASAKFLSQLNDLYDVLMGIIR